MGGAIRASEVGRRLQPCAPAGTSNAKYAGVLRQLLRRLTLPTHIDSFGGHRKKEKF